MKIAQSRPLISTIFIASVVVVVGAKISGKLLQCSEMSLTLLSSSLTFFHDEPKHLGHGRFRGWWWLVLVGSTATGACHPGVYRIKMRQGKKGSHKEVLSGNLVVFSLTTNLYKNRQIIHS